MNRLWGFFFLLLSCNSGSAQRIQIQNIESFDRLDTIVTDGKITLSGKYSFIITNYSSKKISKKDIESFCKMFYEKKQPKVYECILDFYKESDVTNLLNLKKNPSSLYRISQEKDLVYMASIRDNKVIYVLQFKNGKVIDADNKVKVEDVQ